MLNKKFILCLATVLSFCSTGYAFDVPGCVENYNKEHSISGNIEKPETMIEGIVYCHTLSGKGSQDAMEAEQKVNAVIGGYATQLYGKAVAIRAKQVEDSDPKSPKAMAKKVKGLFASKDKKAVVQDKVAPNYPDMAKTIAQIIELEAQIANLEAATVLSRERDGQSQFQKEEDK